MEDTVDSKRRQIEINEWSYHEKMETLFILQLFFIGFATTVILMTLAKYGFFSKLYAIYMGIVMFAVLIVVGGVRRLYTKNVRDKTHWNERQFQGDYSLSSLVPPAVLSATSVANQTVCDAVAASKGTSGTAGTGGTKPPTVTVTCP